MFPTLTDATRRDFLQLSALGAGVGVSTLAASGWMNVLAAEAAKSQR